MLERERTKTEKPHVRLSFSKPVRSTSFIVQVERRDLIAAPGADIMGIHVLWAMTAWAGRLRIPFAQRIGKGLNPINTDALVFTSPSGAKKVALDALVNIDEVPQGVVTGAKK